MELDPAMQPALRIGGALLAGGLSKRMGREKAVLELEGTVLWQRQWEVLSGCVEEMAVVAPERPVWLPGDRNWVPDREEGNGPASGLAGALTWAEESGFGHVFVLAVDMPRVSMEFLKSLADASREGLGVVPHGDNGYEPLCAVYPVEVAGSLAHGLRQGQRKMQDFVASFVDQGMMAVRKLTFIEHYEFLNVNTPSDWRRAGDLK